MAVILATAMALSIAAVVLYWGLSSGGLPPARNLRSNASAVDLAKRGTRPGQGIFAGRYGGNPFYARIEDRGLVIGPPRTGKTAFLFNQILKASVNRVSFVAADMKPELAAILGPSLEQGGYRVIVWNPVTGEGAAYNPLDDLIDAAEINEFVATLLPHEARASTTAFRDAQRDFLRAALWHLHAQGWASLPGAYGLLARYERLEDFLGALEAGPSDLAADIARRLKVGMGKDKLIENGFSSVRREIEYLNLPTVARSLGHSDFSLHQLGQEAVPVALFLQFEESRLGTMGALLSAFYGHIFNVLIQNYRRRGPVALFYDEIGNLPLIEGFTAKLNTIASRNLPTWTYWQSTGQMSRYGAQGEAVIFGSADVQIFFRCNDVGTQETVSRSVGTTLDIRTTVTHAAGRTGSSVSEQRVNVIEPHEVGELEIGEVVCLYRGGKAIGRATPYFVDYPAFLTTVAGDI